eukprot:4634480-Amphidinium_carterae.2
MGFWTNLPLKNPSWVSQGRIPNWSKTKALRCNATRTLYSDVVSAAKSGGAPAAVTLTPEWSMNAFLLELNLNWATRRLAHTGVHNLCHDSFLNLSLVDEDVCEDDDGAGEGDLG